MTNGRQSQSGSSRDTAEAAPALRTFSEATIIAAIPLLGYAVAFFYEAGYATYFHVPMMFISLTLTHVLIATSAVTIILGIFVMGYVGFVIDMPTLKHLAPHVLPLLLFFGMIVFAIGVALGMSLTIIVGVLLSGVLLAFSLRPLLKRKFYETGSILAKKLSLGARDLLSFGLVVTFLSTLSFVFGSSIAANQQNFLVHVARPSVACLRLYGDTLISAEFDESTKKLAGPLHFDKVPPPYSPLQLVEKHIGPLLPP
ncbi:MAG: hypothetical protein ACREX9_06745 [Gammaproteobacteria bacterium]